jgi:hypothetical protein
VISAALANEGRFIGWLAMTAAGAGAVLHIGVRVWFEVFFGPDRGRRPAEAPFAAQLAMGLAGFFCLAIGTNPAWLYELLPEPISFRPFDGHGASSQTQLIVFAVLAYTLVRASQFYPTPRSGDKSGDIWDIDWLYRVPGAWAGRVCIFAAARSADAARTAGVGLAAQWRRWTPRLLALADQPDRPAAVPAVWLLGAAAFLVGCMYLFQAWPDLAR